MKKAYPLISTSKWVSQRILFVSNVAVLTFGVGTFFIRGSEKGCVFFTVYQIAFFIASEMSRT